MGNRKNLPQHGMPIPALCLMLNDFTEKNLRRRGKRTFIINERLFQNPVVTRLKLQDCQRIGRLLTSAATVFKETQEVDFMILEVIGLVPRN